MTEPKFTPGPWQIPKEKMLKTFTAGPWEYDPLGAFVYAGNSRNMVSIVANIRGHGFLTGEGHGALGLSEKEASVVQDKIGRRIAQVPALLDMLCDVMSDCELSDGMRSEIGRLLHSCEWRGF